jgi:2-polyprenyl-3-methyl-5-hydroxy-6-metoxy-1,4-benzoquinol methylase
LKHVQEVKTHFDHLSSVYKQNFADKKTGKNFEFRTRMNLVAQLLSSSSGRLLDCACGTGEITAAVLKSGRFQNAVVADISPEMLTYAKDRISKEAQGSEVDYQQIDIFKYRPSNSQKFDVILCLGLIAHTGNLPKLLEHLKSMLAPGGKILLQSSLLDHWGIRLVRFLTSKKYERTHHYKVSYYRNADIEKAVRAAGFEIASVNFYRFGLPFGDRISEVGNYWVERLTQKISTRVGSDAIYVLQVK